MKIRNKDKLITVIISLALVFLIVWIGQIGIQSIFNVASESGGHGATMDKAEAMTNVLLPVLVVGVICLIATTMFFVVNSEERFSAHYFGYGIVFIAILAIPSYMMYMLYNFAVVEGNTVVTYETLKWIGLMTVAFFGIAGVGYVFKKYFVVRLKFRLEEKKPKGDANV